MLPKLSGSAPPLREVKSPVGQLKDYEDEWYDIFFIFIVFNHKVFILSNDLEGCLNSFYSS